MREVRFMTIKHIDTLNKSMENNKESNKQNKLYAKSDQPRQGLCSFWGGICKPVMVNQMATMILP